MKSLLKGIGNKKDIEKYYDNWSSSYDETLYKWNYKAPLQSIEILKKYIKTKPKFILAVMLDEPQMNSEYVYHYRDGSNIKYKGTPFNTSGWTTVEVTGQIVEKIGPILATKYSEIN